MSRRRSEIVSDRTVLNGEPVVQGTKTPVRAVVELWRLGVAPEEIPTHLPHVALEQVFDALAYYLRNRREIDGYISINRVPDELVHPSVQQKIAA